MKISGSQIKMKMLTEDRWLYRGLLAIHAKQTAEEQHCKETKEDNGQGFNSADANILSSFAEDLLKYSHLTDRQKAVCRSRMLKYSNQLAIIAKQKEN
jgi:hypothetical protein